ncbi:MAG: diadenylate cyclase [Planctomycetota bacterium]|jgi:diadenylate cyclase
MPKPTRQTQALQFTAHAFSLAQSLGIRTAMVLADELGHAEEFKKQRTTERIIWLTHAHAESLPKRPGDLVLSIPEANLARMSQINIGLYAAILRGAIGLSEQVICMAGIAGSGSLDLLLVTKPNKDFPWLRQEDLDRTKNLVAPREFGRLLELALRFAAEGREGKPIGTMFVLGNFEQIQGHLRQLILNPCKGHARKLRSIHNPDAVETLREFSALDGAIIVDQDGIVESAGTYIDASGKNVRLRKGLGARHAAAAAITRATDAISLVISESSGTVTLFDNGKPVLELERPR